MEGLRALGGSCGLKANTEIPDDVMNDATSKSCTGLLKMVRK